MYKTFNTNFGTYLDPLQQNAAFNLLASLRKMKKANNWDYLIAGGRKKGMWSTGAEAAIFSQLIFFLQGRKFVTPLISRLSVLAQQRDCRDTKCTSGSVNTGWKSVFCLIDEAELASNVVRMQLGMINVTISKDRMDLNKLFESFSDVRSCHVVTRCHCADRH